MISISGTQSLSFSSGHQIRLPLMGLVKMTAPLWNVLFVFSILNIVCGNYLIMVPKVLELGGTRQVCIVVTDSSAPSGEITLAASREQQTHRSRSYGYGGRDKPSEKEEPEVTTLVYIVPTVIRIPPGKVEECYDLPIESHAYSYQVPDVTIKGHIAGHEIDLKAKVSYEPVSYNTIIQTDKYLYQPGQMVKFRVLTHYGSLMNVSHEKYPEVWVTSPSKTRIAQWKDVKNPGIVHLEMQLTDEPEEGRYTIHVSSLIQHVQETSFAFNVEEFVLPRFQVNVEPPKYVLANDPGFSFKVCAKYTFGQPVHGNITVKIDNNGHRKCRIEITKKEKFLGCQDFEVSNSEIRAMECRVDQVGITATLAEEGTGVELGGYRAVSLSRDAVSFKTIYNDRYMKFHLPYSLKVRAELPDGSPAPDVGVELCYDGGCSNITTPEDGIIKVEVMNYDSRRVVMKRLISRADMNDASFSADIKRYYSASNSSLKIYSPEGSLKCVPGEEIQYNLQVLFSTPDLTAADIAVQVVSRDIVQFRSSNEYRFNPSEFPFEGMAREMSVSTQSGSSTTGVINIPIELPNTASPSAWVLVWYIRPDGEVVSDSRKLKVENCLSNQVDLQWSSTEVHPGDSATLSISAEPGSLCSIGVVDKSVEMLVPASDALTLDTFFSTLEKYSRTWRGHSQINDYDYCRQTAQEGLRSHNLYTDYVDALKMFDDSGLLIFSNLVLETRPCEDEGRRSYSRRGPVRNRGGGSGRGGGGVYYSSPTRFGMESVPVAAYDSLDDVSMEIEITTMEIEGESEPRTEFPETWLWDIVLLPETGGGSVNQEVTVPDTITEWVGKAVCVSSENGVGLSARKTITTFTPFFLDLTLPPSIKRGEILPVKISVFNYVENQLPVTVALESSGDYEILDASATKMLCLESHNMQVHVVKIRPTTIGDVNITVSASVDYGVSGSCGDGHTRVQKSDSMVRTLPVEADGFPRENAWTKYICSDELQSGSDSLESWDMSSPGSIIEGSDRGWVTVIGDLLALSVENLGHLIRMPSGCGEQNMLNFAPNIYILQYLKATDQNAPEAKEKLLKFMRKGYLRQLLYLRNDGSFSAFGNADDIGSTWLTAFVLKSLAQAKDHMMIDDAVIYNTKKWLKKRSRNGCYESVGTLFNKQMRGGISEDGTSVPLTAYVMIALLESGENSSHPSLKNASECLHGDTSDNLYTKALKAYAFALSEDPSASELIDELLTKAEDGRASLHWDLSEGNSYWRSRSLEVEMASYVILAMLKSNPEVYRQQIIKIVKWVSNSRNGQGGFISTQDTAVALQAMASFESHINRGSLNAVMKVKGADLSHAFNLDESNKLLQQQVTVPNLPTSINLQMTGQGCVLVQAILRYNIPEPEPSDAFSLTVSTRTSPDKTCVTKEISFCSKYLLPDGKSNMVVIEVNLLSGYIPEKEDLKQLVRSNTNLIKRYEVDGSKVFLYIDELTAEETCGKIRIIREIDVEDAKPGSVVVYDYYQTEFSVSKSYELPAKDDCRYAW